jgi:hypothetical protein
LTVEAKGDFLLDLLHTFQKCVKDPADCRSCYQKERDDKATSARHKRSMHIDLVNDTMCCYDKVLGKSLQHLK